MITQTDIDWIVTNFLVIDSKFKTSLIVRDGWNNTDPIKAKPKGLSEDDNEAVFLLDRQKPSEEVSYDFHEERIGITSKGKIIWGFDSGCSCPTPWEDHYPGCYEVTEKTWKEFVVKDISGFDGGYMEEMEKRLQEIKEATK